MKGNVLIVDDDRAMCDLLDFDLRRRGFVVQWRNRAEDAFIQVKEADFDVVLADIHLPGMTGIDLLRAVRSDENLANLPVLMVTAESKREQIIEAAQAGVNGYVVKPFTAGTLEEKINKIFERVAA